MLYNFLVDELFTCRFSSLTRKENTNQKSVTLIPHPSRRAIFKLTQYLINTQEISNT